MNGENERGGHPDRRRRDGASRIEAAAVSEPLSELALSWLRGVLRSEFARVPDFDRSGVRIWEDRRAVPGQATGGAHPLLRDPFGVAARYARGEVSNAVWYREWHHGWRRIQLADQLHRFVDQLRAARSEEAVYRTLTEYAVQIVGGYTCVLFPPQPQAPLRALPNPQLRVDAGRLSISIPLPQPGLIGRDDVSAEVGGPFTELAPLFSEERAVSLAHAPFGEGGVILLVERRAERVFEAGDWELLRLLSDHAAAALARVRLAGRVDVLQSADAVTALAAADRLAPTLEHALSIARHGEPLTVALLRLEGLERLERDDGPAAVERVRRTAADVLRDLTGVLGVTLQRAENEFVLILPRLTPASAREMVARLGRQLPARVGVRCGIRRAEGAFDTPDSLLAATRHALGRAGLATCPGQ